MPRVQAASLRNGSLHPGYHSRHDGLLHRHFQVAGVDLFPTAIALILLTSLAL